MSRIQTLYLRACECMLRAARHVALRRGHAKRLAPHLEMGERGEIAALFHLRKQGYVVVARRWHTPKQRGDLDLVAWEGDTLCFIEVKTRGSHAIASAESAVDEEKQTILRRMARQYMKAIDPPAENARFDVVSVYFENDQPDFQLFRWAFDW